MATDIVADAGKITQSNYTTTTMAATKALPAKTTSVFIRNVDTTDNVLVSFDGTNFFTLKPGDAISLDLRFEASYLVKSSANTPAVQAIYASEA